MDYSVGSRIRVRLYSGKGVEAEITAITNQSTGRKTSDRVWQRDRVDQSSADYRSPPGNVVPKQLQVGSTVVARFHDDREVEARITKIVDSVVGRKVHIAFGAFALVIDEVQIVREARHDR